MYKEAFQLMSCLGDSIILEVVYTRRPPVVAGVANTFSANNAYQLRNTPYGIRQQFPKEIEDNRRKLYPIQKEAKRQGKHVVLVRDRLYIEYKKVLNSSSVFPSRTSCKPVKMRLFFIDLHCKSSIELLR
jgi:hypothetical protein